MTTPPPEQEARELLIDWFSKIRGKGFTDSAGFEQATIELTTLITKARERDKLQFQLKEFEILGDKIIARLGTNHTSVEDALNSVLAERDSYREKAEALDWLENNKVIIDYRTELIRVDYINYKTLHVVSSEGSTLLSAITAAKKGFDKH
jgi:hypothetical protein